MRTRRTLLKGGITLASASFAGCTDRGLSERGSGGPEGSGRRFDAGAAMGAETSYIASADVQAVLEAPLPEWVHEEVDRFDEAFDSVESSEFESLDVSGFVDDDQHSGFTAILSGSYDIEELRRELLEPERAEAPGAYRGTERYLHTEDAVALTDEAIVYGDGFTGDEALDLVDRGLDALEGDAPTFVERRNGAVLRRELSGDLVAAVDPGPGAREELRSAFEDGEFAAVVEATAAFGIDATFDGDRTDVTYVLVADESEVDVDTVREVADAIEASDESTIEDVSVSRDGRAIIATAEVATGDLFESHGAALRAIDPERGDDQVRRTAPNATFRFEYDDGVLAVTHAGGDSVPAAELYLAGDVTYETGDGSWAATGGADDVVSAGHSVSVGGPDSGYDWAGQPGEGKVRVLWDADGSTPATLGSWER